MSEINQKLMSIQGVEHALLMTRDGVAVDDSTYDAEVLGAYTSFLASFGYQLGTQFGVGELKSVAVHGCEHHMFLYESKNHHLGVSAKGAGNFNALDAEIRRVLAQK